MAQQLQQGYFHLQGANITPPPSDTFPKSSNIDMSKLSRHSSHHSKISTWRHKRLEERTNAQQPNNDLRNQFKQLAKQVEALEVQKKKVLYIERYFCPNPLTRVWTCLHSQKIMRHQYNSTNTEAKGIH